jgi:hypothetical protein
VYFELSEFEESVIRSYMRAVPFASGKFVSRTGSDSQAVGFLCFFPFALLFLFWQVGRRNGSGSG